MLIVPDQASEVGAETATYSPDEGTLLRGTEYVPPLTISPMPKRLPDHFPFPRYFPGLPLKNATSRGYWSVSEVSDTEADAPAEDPDPEVEPLPEPEPLPDEPDPLFGFITNK